MFFLDNHSFVKKKKTKNWLSSNNVNHKSFFQKIVCIELLRRNLSIDSQYNVHEDEWYIVWLLKGWNIW